MSGVQVRSEQHPCPTDNGRHRDAKVLEPMFDLLNACRVRLEKLWVDELVYASSGRKDVSEKAKDLRLKMICTNILVIMPITKNSVNSLVPAVPQG